MKKVFKKIVALAFSMRTIPIRTATTSYRIGPFYSEGNIVIDLLLIITNPSNEYQILVVANNI